MTRVIVIGGGHNGLVAALELARSGRSVTVVERESTLGGICRPIELGEGHSCPGVLDDNWFDAKSVAGLKYADAPELHVLDGDSLRPVGTPQQLLDFAGRVAPAVRRVLEQAPPPLIPQRVGELVTLAKTGLGLRRLGADDMTELMRIAPMSAADLVGEHLSDAVDAEWWSGIGARHGYTGPRSAGTAANLLFSTWMSRPPIDGGPPAIIAALESACRAANVTIRTDAEVTKVLVEDGRAVGVRIGDEELSGDVLATCATQHTMLQLLPRDVLPARAEAQARNIRSRGTTAKWMIGLRSAPDLPSRHIWIGTGSVNGLERTFDAVKYGRFSDVPALEVTVHGDLLSVLVSYVPHTLRGGWTDDARNALRTSALERLALALPGIESQIAIDLLWTPADLERNLHLPGGCLHHVEHALDQLLFMRPTADLAHFQTPVDRLFVGGGGHHPCGGITGIPGKLAAQALLKATRRL